MSNVECTWKREGLFEFRKDGTLKAKIAQNEIERDWVWATFNGMWTQDSGSEPSYQKALDQVMLRIGE